MSKKIRVGIDWTIPSTSLLHPVFIVLASVVQTLDSAIHRINHYPVDSAIGFPNTFPPDNVFSDG